MSDQDKFDRQDPPGSAIQEFAEKIIRRDEAMKETIMPTDREKQAPSDEALELQRRIDIQFDFMDRESDDNNIAEMIDSLIQSSADRIALLEYTFGHTHKRSEEGDLCKICGLDLRDQIHLRDIGSESKVAAKNDIERGGHGTEEYV